MTDQEQIQQIKDWWKKYGLSLILGVVIALIGTSVWRYWQRYEFTESQQASDFYEQMLISMNTQKNPQFQQSANELMKNYSKTPYAAMAGLLLANNAVASGDLDAAVKNLAWVEDHAKNSSVRQIAIIREARVLLAQNKFAEAMKILQSVADKNYFSEVQIVKGDILAAQGKNADARNAYQEALNSLPPSAAIRASVQMKSDELN